MSKYSLYSILLYSLLFLFVGLLIFSSFLWTGTSFIWNIDGIGQFYPSFLYIGRFLREILQQLFIGNLNIPLFDLRIGMGEDIIGSLNYYGFGDPINLLAIFATKETGPLIWMLTYVFRLWLAGLSFLAYARYMKIGLYPSILAAIAYAYSTFALLGGMMYSQFLSPLIFLPLILLGCEKIWRENRYLFLVLAVAYAALSHFYFLYMVSLYLIGYCLVRTFYLAKSSTSRLGSMLFFIGKVFVAYLCGISLSLPILYPFLRQLFQSNRSNVSPLSLVLDGNNWLPHLGNIRYFLSGWKLPGFMHGQRPVSSYSRWIYYWQSERNYWSGIPIFIYISPLFLLRGIRKPRNQQLILALFLGGVAFSLPITYVLTSAFSSSYDRWVFILYFHVLVGFAVLLDGMSYHRNRLLNLGSRFGIPLFLVVNIVVSGLSLYEHWRRQGDEFIALADVNRYIDSPVMASTIIQADKSLFRVSNDSFSTINGRPENIAMLHSYHGLTFWLSAINSRTQNLVNHLADRDGDYRSYGFNDNTLYESLASVKYSLKKPNTLAPVGYKKVEDLVFYGEKWEVYQNPYALELVYAVPNRFQSNMQAAIEISDVSVLKYVTVGENLRYKQNEIEAEITLEEESEVILAIPYSENWSVAVNGTKKNLYESDLYYIALHLSKGHHQLKFSYSY